MTHVSVVIGFKDWGIERLLLSVRSLVNAFGSLEGEVIVSDYGSTNTADLSDLVEEAGARYVYTPTNGVWSRSRALNAGFAVAKGEVLVSTDADMLFSPFSMEVIGERVLANPTEALVLQCRDLPERFDASAIAGQSSLSWREFDDAATLRPRWGMGGMMAVSRSVFLALRGFDERMEIYGGEDMDFAQRVRWAGNRLSWIEDPRVRMFHIWHPSSRLDVSRTEAGAAAIAYNRDILLNDRSVVRNTTAWLHKPIDAPPLASVVISTRNRAQYISESINSVRAQTAGEIEIIVVDDGSSDETEQVVLGINDDRIRYYKREAAGIAAARNFAATVTRSRYTVIHDDDDLMFPDRIENHFAALTAGSSGSYGGWIDFQNADGTECQANPGRSFSLQALLFSSKVYAHATLMIETDLIRSVRYDEKLRSGSDYNLALRLARTGVRLAHTGRYHLIRRLHDHQVTSTDSAVQKGSARVSSSLALRSMRPGKQKQIRERMKTLPTMEIQGTDSPWSLIAPYLPDHLVRRTVAISGPSVDKIPPSLAEDSRLRYSKIIDNRTGLLSEAHAELLDATWDDFVALRVANIKFTFEDVQTAARLESGNASQVDYFGVVSDKLAAFLNQSDYVELLVLIGNANLFPEVTSELIADIAIKHKDGRVDARAYEVDRDVHTPTWIGALAFDRHQVRIELQRRVDRMTGASVLTEWVEAAR